MTYLKEDLNKIVSAIRGLNGISGSIDITENGTYDVGEVETAVVNVPQGGGGQSADLDQFIAGNITDITSNLEIIPDFAFSSKSKLKTVNLPNAVYIGKYAFSSAVADGNISGSDSSSGSDSESSSEDEDMSFNNNSLITVNMPKVTNIEKGAFQGDENLTITQLPDNLMVIKENAFANCPNVQLTDLPNEITYVGYNAFDSGHLNFESIEDIFNKEHLTYLGYLISRDLVTNYFNTLDQEKIDNGDLSEINPQYFKGFQVEGSSWQTFYNNNIANWQNIIFPEGIKIIGTSAFNNCNALTSLTLPDSLTSIGDSAFYNCYALASLILPDSLTTIGEYAFYNCYALASLILPDSLTTIGDCVFQNCHVLTSLTLPNSLTSIGNQAFQSCNALTTLTLPNSLTSIGNRAFQDCNALTTLTLPNSLTSIGDNAFNACKSLITLTIPNSVTNIGDYAFADGSLTLQTVDLTQFTNENPVPQIGRSIFSGTCNTAGDFKILFSNQEVLDNFANATNWSEYADYFQVAE